MDLLNLVNGSNLKEAAPDSTSTSQGSSAAFEENGDVQGSALNRWRRGRQKNFVG